MSDVNLGFDKALYEIYEETNDADIDPFIYLARHFDIIKNQIDIFALTRQINDEKYLKLIEAIECHEKECIINCRQNYSIFQHKLKSVLWELNVTNKGMPQTKDFVEKRLKIRKEWIETKNLIFRKNVIFVDVIDKKDIGSLFIVEPFGIDDQQIDLIK